MLYVAAEPVDAANLKLLADTAGSDLKMPVEFLPPPGGFRVPRHDLFLADVRCEELPFSPFGESLPAAIGPLRFGGGLTSKPLPGGLVEDILATYSDRSAALVTASCGAGTLSVFNADLNECNIVGSPVFVPLVEELVNRLLSRPIGEEAVSSGEPWRYISRLRPEFQLASRWSDPPEVPQWIAGARFTHRRQQPGVVALEQCRSTRCLRRAARQTNSFCGRLDDPRNRKRPDADGS